MTALRLTPTRPSPEIIDAAIALHGPGRVLWTALRALFRPRTRPPDLNHLPEHIRRDIGLLPRPYDPLPSRFRG